SPRHRRRPALHSFPTRRSSDLLPREHRRGLLLEVDERLTGDVHDHLTDGAAREGVGPRSRVLLGYRLAGVLADVETLADEGEVRSEEHTSELQSREKLVCRLLL